MTFFMLFRSSYLDVGPGGNPGPVRVDKSAQVTLSQQDKELIMARRHRQRTEDEELLIYILEDLLDD